MIKVILNQHSTSVFPLDDRLIFDIYSLGMCHKPLGVLYQAQVSGWNSFTKDEAM